MAEESIAAVPWRHGPATTDCMLLTTRPVLTLTIQFIITTYVYCTLFISYLNPAPELELQLI